MKIYFVLKQGQGQGKRQMAGEEVGEIHWANKPLDPNYKPEHQSKSNLPSVTGKSSPIKTPRKPKLKMPTDLSPKH